MASESKHYLDVNRWIEQVIDSCTTVKQTVPASILINNFEKYLVDYTDPDFNSKLIRSLRERVWHLREKLI